MLRLSHWVLALRLLPLEYPVGKSGRSVAHLLPVLELRSHREGFAMSPLDKFDWYTIGAALLAILVVVVVVELLH